jgi:hypothetical protein
MQLLAVAAKLRLRPAAKLLPLLAAGVKWLLPAAVAKLRLPAAPLRVIIA